MRQRTYGAVLPAMVVLLGLAGAGGALAREPTPLPFDEALSIYVGHDGTWLNYATYEEAAVEIEDRVAAFQPGEEVSDDPEVWCTHQINAPAAPTGWVFFSPTDSGPMQLHVIIRDTENRLKQAVITDRYTGEPQGTLSANLERSEIEGWVSVEPLAEAFNLEVTQWSTNNTLFRAGANNPRVDDALAVTVSYGWNPNRGDEHGPCPVTMLGPPWGDPLDTEGKVSVGQVLWWDACGGPVGFENDDANCHECTARYNLAEKQIPRDTTAAWQEGAAGGLPLKARQSVQAAIAAAQQAYTGGAAALTKMSLVPYSKGTAHWPMRVQGGLKSLLYAPYMGVSGTKHDWELKLQGSVSDRWGAGLGQREPEVAIALSYSWGKDEEKLYQCGPPQPVGSVWGLLCSALGGPSAWPLQCITTPVTFELWADHVPPDGEPGRIGGTADLHLDQAWTTPAPPTPMGLPGGWQLQFPPDGEQKGLATVELAKGWKWKADHGHPWMMGYSEGIVAPFEVPQFVWRRMECHLQVLLCLKVKTEYADHTKAPSRVELYQLQGRQWTLIGGGDTVPQPPPNGDQIWTRGIPLDPGAYKIRAQSKEGMQPGPWTEVMIEAAIGIEKTETVTVVRGQGPGGP